MTAPQYDELVKRLASWGTAAGLGAHFLGKKTAREDCAEAAAAIRELVAERDALIHDLNRLKDSETFYLNATLEAKP